LRLLKKYLENELFKIYQWDNQSGRHIIKHSVPYKIRWEDNFVIDNDAIYYFCIGCEIKSIVYRYGLPKCEYGSFQEFKKKSILLIPSKENNVITIYKGDVIVTDYDPVCPEADSETSFLQVSSYEYSFSLLFIIVVSVLLTKIGNPTRIDIAVRFSALSYAFFITFMLCQMFFAAFDVQFLNNTDLPLFIGIFGYIVFLIVSFVLCLTLIKKGMGNKIKICVIMWAIPMCIMLCILLIFLVYILGFTNFSLLFRRSFSLH
jgi:hypothetical protein